MNISETELLGVLLWIERSIDRESIEMTYALQRHTYYIRFFPLS